MKIHYVINNWGHYMPIFFDKCCEPMTRLFSPETKPFSGFWFDNADGNLKEFGSGLIANDKVTQCRFCHKDIEFTERELKQFDKEQNKTSSKKSIKTKEYKNNHGN